MKHSIISILFFILCFSLSTHAEENTRKIDTSADTIVPVNLSESGFKVLEQKKYGEESLPTVNLNPVEVLSPRYTDPVKASRYARLRRNVMIVYPYAKMAAELLEEIDHEMSQMNRRRHQRRYAREMQRNLRDEFEVELRDLTVTQGKILVQLINRETGDDCYRLIRELRGSVQALAWQTFARFHGYDLREPYIAEDNPDLERIVKSLENTNFPVEISRK